jgi:hypothetical protein
MLGYKRGFEHPALKPEDDRPETDRSTIVRAAQGGEWELLRARKKCWVVYLKEKTIEGWYYGYRARGLDGLTPKVRADRGQSKLSAAVQAAILAAKRENPRRSIRHRSSACSRSAASSPGG